MPYGATPSHPMSHGATPSHPTPPCQARHVSFTLASPSRALSAFALDEERLATEASRMANVSYGETAKLISANPSLGQGFADEQDAIYFNSGLIGVTGFLQRSVTGMLFRAASVGQEANVMVKSLAKAQARGEAKRAKIVIEPQSLPSSLYSEGVFVSVRLKGQGGLLEWVWGQVVAGHRGDIGVWVMLTNGHRVRIESMDDVMLNTLTGRSRSAR